MIPWDDDADILVPIEARDRMYGSRSQELAAARGFRFQHGYLPASADGYYSCFAKYMAVQKQELLTGHKQPAPSTAQLDMRALTTGFFSRARLTNPPAEPVWWQKVLCSRSRADNPTRRRGLP